MEVRGNLEVNAGSYFKDGIDFELLSGVSEWEPGTTYTPPDIVKRTDGLKYRLYVNTIGNSDVIFNSSNWSQLSLFSEEARALFSVSGGVLIYAPSSGNFSIVAASAGQSGYLSGTDFVIFQNKQDGFTKRYYDYQSVTNNSFIILSGIEGRHDIEVRISGDLYLSFYVILKNSTTFDVYVGFNEPVSDLQGTTNKLNVYLASGVLNVENKLGSTIEIRETITRSS